MMSYARIHLTHCDPDYSKTDSYLIDLVRGRDGLPVPKVTFFGLWGQLKQPDNRYPIVVLNDGRIDLGSVLGADAETGPARYQRTNLHQRAIRVDELVTIWEIDDEDPDKEIEYTLRIQKITTIEGLI